MRTLATCIRDEGMHRFDRDGRMSFGKEVAAGLQLYRLAVRGHVEDDKCVREERAGP